jgi:hypothetical protein
MRLDPTRALQDCGAHAEHIPFAFTPSSCRQSASAHYYLLLCAQVYTTQYVYIYSKVSAAACATQSKQGKRDIFSLRAHVLRRESENSWKDFVPAGPFNFHASEITLYTKVNAKALCVGWRKKWLRALAEKRIRGNGAVMPKPVSNEAKHLRS